MNAANDSKIATNKKQIILHFAFVIISFILIISILFFLFSKYSGAWLVSKGKWTDAIYNVGRIDYSYEINNENVNTEVQDFTATVPIIGGVKINDSYSVSSTDSNYQVYSEENFNEGVTLAHIIITNKSDFKINVTTSFTFDNLFDSSIPKDIFYLVLPQGSAIDTTNHTVTLSDYTVTYKNYIKSCMSDYSTYDLMKSSLSTYYTNNPTLKTQNYTLAAPNNITDTQLEFNILFWSEYNENLPFVTGTGSSETLDSENSTVDALTGQFKFKMDILQNNS